MKRDVGVKGWGERENVSVLILSSLWRSVAHPVHGSLPMFLCLCGTLVIDIRVCRFHSAFPSGEGRLDLYILDAIVPFTSASVFSALDPYCD